jgi:hypothetical protein
MLQPERWKSEVEIREGHNLIRMIPYTGRLHLIKVFLRELTVLLQGGSLENLVTEGIACVILMQCASLKTGRP